MTDEEVAQAKLILLANLANRKLAADNARLRALVKAVETIRHAGRGDKVEHICPWCLAERGRDYLRKAQPHRPECDAFNPDGSVR